ncbi:Arm DNA-binding domain-containing protein [Novacetimonas pomaceti]|uniref:Arm DNA-binding domain-containing protein n=1 Tax=Novacetimonas pomaceti TaxID=2021998 RepID=UPI001EF07A3D|nr:Arm DNA-binding domain-containing protein [Novacetimonas pomaceti]
MLTDAKIRSAKPADRAWRLADTGGLFVHITPAGKKIWRYRYKFEKREKLLTLGHYPGVSLTDARAEREKARRILREGRDPSVEAKIVRLAARVNTATTFEAVARMVRAA